MPKGKKKSGRKPKKVQVVYMGGGFWDSLKDVASKTNDFLKSTKVISKVSGALQDTPYVGGVATAVNKASTALGYGQQRGKGYKL